MNKIDKLAKTLKAAQEDKKTTSPYDTTAKVVRVEGGTAYVNIPGGVEETPAAMVVSAKKGDTVMVNVSGGKAYVTGNETAPPTDDSYAMKAETAAKVATQAANTANAQALSATKSAQSAQSDAAIANKSATEAVRDAKTANEAATQAVADAATAKSAADAAQESADAAQDSADQAQADATAAKASATNANEYASRALGHLSTVENVTETLNWITAHGTMTLTTDTALDPSHVYFVVNANGDYIVGNTHYSIVTEPSVDDLSTYYELSIDESLNNYVATHLAVDGEGLWIIPEDEGFKILISTGNGTTYSEPGTYIIDDTSTGDVVSKFTANEAQIGRSGESYGHVEIDPNGMGVYKGDESVASFGDTMRVGKEDSYNITVTPDGVSGTNSLGQGYFGINFDDSTTISSPVRTNQKYSERITGPGSRTYTEKIVSGLTSGNTLTVNNNIILMKLTLRNVSSYTTVSTSNMSVASSSGQVKLYTSGSSLTFTVGTSKTLTFSASVSTNTGATISFSETAQYDASTGIITYTIELTRTGTISIDGNADNYFYTLSYSATMGFLPSTIHVGTTDSDMGKCSSAFGLSLRAQYDYQTVVGKFNNNASGTLFEIGNGTGTSARSNAFAVSSEGNVNIPSGAKYKINGTALSASDVGAVPTSRTVNSKALSSNISLTASDVGALSTSGGTISGNLSISGSLTLSGHSTAIGSTISGSLATAKNMTASTWIDDAAHVQLTAGTWLIYCGCRYGSSSTGYRVASFGPITNGAYDHSYHATFVPTNASSINQLTFCRVVTVSSTVTYYLNTMSTAATTLQSGGAQYGTYIMAIRLV